MGLWNSFSQKGQRTGHQRICRSFKSITTDFKIAKNTIKSIIIYTIGVFLYSIQKPLKDIFFFANAKTNMKTNKIVARKLIIYNAFFIQQILQDYSAYPSFCHSSTYQ